MSKVFIDKNLYFSKPNPENRLQKEMDSYEILDSLDIPYTRLDHDPTASIEDCEEVDSLLGIEICKNLFLCNGSKTEFYLLMMPGNKKFVTKTLSKQIECSRLSFADASYMEEFINITPGSVSVLGLMYDKEKRVKLLIDREVLSHEYFGCHPCVNTSSLKIKVIDLIDKFLPHIGHEPKVVDL